MEYLQAAILLKSFIQETNTLFLAKKRDVLKDPNKMRIMLDGDNAREIVMESFTNEFLKSTLQKMDNPKAFVFTDIATMELKGKEMTYLLYKGYHSDIEKGMVFYQLIDKETLSPKGSLRFSNLEENIFYTINDPPQEESSCNAMETNNKIEDGKSIVFFIGHMNEERLAYDIQRLIFDTVHNVTKHPSLKFSFIISIARYGGKSSEKLKNQVKKIEEYTEKEFYPEYPNATFEFTYEQEAS